MIIWPFLAYGFILLCLRRISFRRSFPELLIISFIFWHLLVLIATQVLSYYHVLNEFNVFLFWLFVTGLFSIALWSLPRKKGFPSHPLVKDPLMTDEVLLIAAVIFLSVLVFVNVVYSAPASFDVLAYHLSRVVHWIQNGETSPYPTHITRQLFSPPLTSYVQAHLYLLSGGDYWANIPQFFAMILTLCSVSLLGKTLLLTRREILVSLLVIASLPLGIMQASSALNDYTLSLWVIIFIYFGYKYTNSKDILDLCMTTVAAGLIFLTKINGFLVILPFSVLFLSKSKLGIKQYLLFAGIFLCISLPWIDDLRYLKDILYYPYNFSPRSNLSFINSQWGILENINRHIELQFSFNPPDESYASNPFHALLAFFAGIVIVLKESQFTHRIRIFLFCLVCGVVLVCGVIKFNSAGSRFLLPSLILFAPVIAVIICRIKAAPKLILGGLFVMALCVAVFYSTRPLLGKNNILRTPRQEQYLMNLSNKHNDVVKALDALIQQNCYDIGLVYDLWGDTVGLQREYLLLQRMKSIGRSFRMEHVNVVNASASFDYSLGNFEPCGVILSTSRHIPNELVVSNEIFVLLNKQSDYAASFIKKKIHE